MAKKRSTKKSKAKTKVSKAVSKKHVTINRRAPNKRATSVASGPATPPIEMGGATNLQEGG